MLIFKTQISLHSSTPPSINPRLRLWDTALGIAASPAVQGAVGHGASRLSINRQLLILDMKAAPAVGPWEAKLLSSHGPTHKQPAMAAQQIRRVTNTQSSSQSAPAIV